MSLLFFLWVPVTHSQKPASAEIVLKEAMTKAKAEKKNVFIIFHASWCGWCRKMEASINDESIKQYFNDNYVIRYLTVYESGGKENLENPGAAGPAETI